MRVVIFGAGKMFQIVKKNIKKEIEIVAFLDNDTTKWGDQLDNIPILAPHHVIELEYDYIFLLSNYYLDMRLQLRSLGIPEEKVFDLNHMEKIRMPEPVQCYGEVLEETKKKKIVIFSHALSSTGAQNVLYIAAGVLQQKGYSLIVVSRTDGELKERFLKQKIPIIIMRDIFWGQEKLNELVDWADVVFVNTLWLDYVVEELQGFGKKIIWWIHETGALQYLSDSLFSHITEIGCTSIYAVSPLVKRKIIQKYGENPYLYELLYGLPRYYAEKVSMPNEKKIFAIIGGIAKIKGQDIFIKAVEQLPNPYKNKAEFWIIGGGKVGEEEEQIIEKTPSIKVKGNIENQKMPEIYKQIDVVVCCSREDAMPVAVTEGCMNGKTAIISDITGIAEYVVNGQNGLIFESEKIEQLTELIKWVLDQEERAKQIGEASKEIYEKYFSMEVFERNLVRVIEDSIVERID